MIKTVDWRIIVTALLTAKVSRRCERALMRFEGKLTGTEHSKLQKLGRVSSVNITSIRVWRCGTRMRGSGKQGWCRLLSHGTPEPRSPLHPGLVVPPPFHFLARARESVWKRARILRRRRRGIGATAKLHDLRILSALKLFPANRKNSPSSPTSPPRTPSVFCIATFSRLTRRAAHCFNRIASILNCH